MYMHLKQRLTYSTSTALIYMYINCTDTLYAHMGMIIHTCMVIHAYAHSYMQILIQLYSHTRKTTYSSWNLFLHEIKCIRALELLNPLTPGVEKKTYFWTFSARKHDSMPFFPQASCFMTLLLGMSKIKILRVTCGDLQAFQFLFLPFCFFIFLHASFYCQQQLSFNWACLKFKNNFPRKHHQQGSR